jgi:hemerythrin
MPVIHWSDEYSLGLPAIDKDHRELVEQCNEYLLAVEDGASLERLAEIMDRLILRTRAHFIAEERLLDRHNYPGLALHKSDHDRLVTQAESLKARFSEADEDDESTQRLIAETGEFMRSWLLDHIRVNDRPFKPFLRSLS